MVHKWFVHRRSEQARAARPLGKHPPTYNDTESPPELKKTVQKPSITTEVLVDHRNGSRKTKTIITIGGGRKLVQSSQSLPASAVSSFHPKTPQRAARAASMSTPSQRRLSSAFSTPSHLRNTPVEPMTSCAALEESMESFGIETPSSPSSTLRSRTKVINLRNSLSSPSSYDGRSRSSMTSVETAATVVDDGLSPWGLPKVLDPADDEGDEEEFYDAEHGMAFEHDLNYDAEFSNSAFKAQAKALPQSSTKIDFVVAADKKKEQFQINQAKTVVYLLRRVTAHKLAERKAELAAAATAATAATTPSIPHSSASLSSSKPSGSVFSRFNVLSSFGSWM